MPMPSKEDFKAEFHKLKGDEAALLAQLEPIQAKYHAVTEEAERHRDQYIKPIITEMKPLKDQLHDVQMEMAQIVKFLRGSNGIADTGDAPPPAAAAKKKQ